MKVFFLMNGLTHYFNLITSKINEQQGVEIIYVYPKEKGMAMGEGVFQTTEGANFQLIGMTEKMDPEINSLCFEDLDVLLNDLKPDLIMVGESHLGGIVFDKKIKKIIEEQKIKIVLKSIPFRVKKYDEYRRDFKLELKDNPTPPFNSFPASIKKKVKSIKLDVAYKNLFLDKRAFRQKIKALNLRKYMFNYVDAHVNYIEDAYEIYGSYGVPKEKIFVTYNSPDTDFYFSVKEKIEKEPAILPANKFRLIHLSRLVEWKRVDMLVTAVANLKEKFPEIELLVIGEGPEKENLIKQAELLKVGDRVKFLGGVYDPETLGKYIMSSTIYVLAGMGGLSINDAMIFGLPVICSVCDGTEKHLVKEGYNGLYFNEGDQDSLEEKINYLFNNPELSSQMGRNSTQIIEDDINIHTVVKRYIGAFNSVFHKTPIRVEKIL